MTVTGSDERGGPLVPVPPRHAATVLLLRDGPGGIEVFLLRRVLAMAFAGGMTAFPGGAVDARDADTAVGWAGPPATSWTRRLGADAGLAHALVCAAVRETFEEAGVLLAGRSTAAVADPTGGTWPADRAALERHELSLAQLLARRRLVLRADLLAPWSHWITPAAEPRRYDTRFFVAALPAGQRTADSTGEADDVAWRRPLDALAEAAAGTRRMFPPTVVSLREIAPYADVGAVLRAAAERPVETITPTVRHRQVVLPDGTSFAAPGP